MNVRIFDHTTCQLGEGPLWHPLRQELFWFDIIGKKMFARKDEITREWAFDEHVSAAGWIDQDHLLVASETALQKFQISTGETEFIAALESENDQTRSNDGRADPWGGFWIGTMGLNGEDRLGAIYRYYRGAVRRLFTGITVSNSICFSPDQKWAYYTDTLTQNICRQALEPEDGWPVGAPEMFIDLKAEKKYPDGSVCDMDGNLWNAQWGGSRIAQYSPEGVFMSEIKLPTSLITCPAFGGEDRTTLFVTSADIDLSETQKSAQPDAGKTFVVQTDFVGQPEHQVIL